jgi:hypothetical protein
MQFNKLILLFCLPALFLVSCITRFEPEISTMDYNKIVVSGYVNDSGGEQTVTISRSIPLSEVNQKAMPGCTVTISDDKGHQFPMTDASDGNYHCYIDPIYIIQGSSFNVDIVTPDGDNIVSDFDFYSSSPKVDSIYYMREDLTTGNPTKIVQGIQFYVDLKGDNSNSRFFRFEPVETWEYHVEYAVEWYYSGGREPKHVWPPDSTNMVCWRTYLPKNIFTLSTKDFSENKYRLLPLHFIDNTTSRLVYGYSLLVNQYSLSEAAYNYWNQLRINSSSEGGLYEKQPLATKGNLRNLTHPDQAVLGFFGVSAVTSKRIFVSKVENLPLLYYSSCTPDPLSIYGFSDYGSNQWPLYLMGDRNGWQPMVLDKECVDCRVLWGKNMKPDFWPN